MSIIVISILAILGWTSLFKQTFTTTEGFRYKYYFARTLISSVDFKPLSCAYCLSFLDRLRFSLLLLWTLLTWLYFYTLQNKTNGLQRVKMGSFKELCY